MRYKRTLQLAVFITILLLLLPENAAAKETDNSIMKSEVKQYIEKTNGFAVPFPDDPPETIPLEWNDPFGHVPCSDQESVVTTEGMYMASVRACGTVLMISASALLLLNRKKEY